MFDKIFNEDILDKFQEIQNTIEDVDNVDFDNIDDLKKAKKAIETTIEKIDALKDDDLASYVVSFAESILGVSCLEFLDEALNSINKRINELTVKNDDCKSSCCDRQECDCSENYVCDCCDVVDLEEEPVTGEDIYGMLDYDVLEKAKSTFAQKVTLCENIAKFMNERCTYACEKPYFIGMVNTLFEYSDYTLNK